MAEDEDERNGEGEDGAEEKGGRRVGMLVLIAGILGGLIIGGGAVYFLAGGGEEEPAAEQEEAAVAAPKEPAVDLLVVPVRRFAVPLINADMEVLGYMWVDLAFEVDGPANQSFVAARLPELRDAFLRDLHSRSTTREDRPGALDFDLVHERLEIAARETLGEGRVLAVRITNAQRVPE